jgi:hypothetical protein
MSQTIQKCQTLGQFFESLYQLYSMLKDRNDPPTSDEVDIASGKMQLDGHAEAEYLKKLENTSENIKKAFEDQRVREAVSDDLFSTLHLIHKLSKYVGAVGPGEV